MVSCSLLLWCQLKHEICKLVPNNAGLDRICIVISFYQLVIFTFQKPSREGKAVGCLQNKKLGLVMKTLQEGDRGRRETAFYRKIFVDDPEANLTDKDSILFLRDFVPKFYGLVQVMIIQP